MLERVKQIPLIIPLRKKLFEKKFTTHQNVHYFRGLFSSFHEAASSAPMTKPKGYNNSLAAKLYKERTKQLYSTDYPVLFWLEKVRVSCKKIFDFGGHIGVSFYSYSKVFDMSALETWTVCDVESVVAEGRSIAGQQKVTQLNFVTEIKDCDGFDLFLANGSLQFLEWELHTQLKKCKSPPQFLIINMLPLHPSLKTITLHSTGTTFCPYHLRVASHFINGLESIGYKLVDSWENKEKSCHIAFEAERSVKFYKGMFFTYTKNGPRKIPGAV
jgi:putative methyltransferase (TIGR04325 family)